DGIRDKLVTGVQTCALPILLGAAVFTRTLGLSTRLLRLSPSRDLRGVASAGRVGAHARLQFLGDASAHLSFAARAWYAGAGEPRSEERRVGKGGGCGVGEWG